LLRDYINDTLRPEFDGEMERIIEEFNAGIENAENTITEYKTTIDASIEAFETGTNAAIAAFQASVNAAIAAHETAVDTRMDTAEADINTAKTGWQTLFNQFMADVEAELAALNDAAVAGLVGNGGTATGVALDARFALQVHESLNILNEGAIGDGITDDTAAINAALLKWETARANRPGDLVFPGGKKYKVTAGLSIAPTDHIVFGRISGHGSEIEFPVGTDYGLTVNGATHDKTIKGLKLDGLTFLNAGLRLKSSSSSVAVYNVVVSNQMCDQVGNGHGIWIDGAFECQLYSPVVTMTSTNTVYNGIFTEASTGDTSSLEIYSPTTRHGQYGIYSNLADCKIFGGTGLSAKKEALYMNNAEGSIIAGYHAENNWESAVGQVSGNAGVRVIGSAAISGVLGTANNGKQAHAVRVFASPNVSIVSGIAYNALTYAYLDGANNSSISLIGVPSYTASAQYDVSSGTATGKLIRVGAADNTAKAFSLGGAASKSAYFAATDPASTMELVNRLRTALCELGLLRDPNGIL
jgi:hypothetical protein